LQGAVDEGLQQRGVVEEVTGEFRVDEYPAAAIKSIAVVIDLQDRGRELAAVFDAPGERVEAGVERAGGASAVVEIDGAEANDGAEGVLPGECGKLQGDLGIGLELQAVGAGSVLVLIDHERADAAHAVVAKMPSAAVAIGGASEGHAAEDQQIASAVEKLFDGGPGVFGKGGAGGKDKKSRCGDGQSFVEVVRANLLGSRKQGGELLRRGSRRVGCEKAGFREDDHGRGGGLGKECEWDQQ
jgi:hypothetical protein